MFLLLSILMNLAVAAPAAWEPLDAGVTVEAVEGPGLLELRFGGARTAVVQLRRSRGPDEPPSGARCTGGGVDLFTEAEAPWVQTLCGRLGTRPPEIPADTLPAWGEASAVVVAGDGQLDVRWEGVALRYARAPGVDAQNQPRCVGRQVGLWIDAAPEALVEGLCTRLAMRPPALPAAVVWTPDEAPRRSALRWAHGGLGLLTGAVMLAWVARRRAWRLAGVVAGASLGWLVLATRWLGPALPASAFQPLREGFSLQHLRFVTGSSLDVGPVPEVVWRSWLAIGPPSMREAVTANLVLGGWAAILLAALLAATARDRLLGAALWLGIVASPAWLTASTSPLHASAAAFEMLLVACLVAMGGRWAALAAAGWCVSLPGVRPELLAFSVATVLGLGVVRWEPRWTAWVDARVWPRVWWWGVLLGWVLLHPLLVQIPAPRVDGPWGWLVAGLHPARWDVLTLPVVLAAMLPLGVVLLAGVGCWRAVRRPASLGFLPAAVLAVFMAARAAAHGLNWPAGDGVAAYELYRYGLGLLAPVAVLAVAGAASVSLDGPRRWALVVLCLFPALPSAVRPLGLWPAEAVWPQVHGFEADPLLEQRRLVGLLEADDCAVLTIGRVWEADGEDKPFRWAAILRNRLERDVVRVGPPVTEAGLEEALRLLRGEDCAVGWRSLDCAVVGEDPCEALAGLPPVDMETIEHGAFVHPEHGSRWPSTIEVGTVALPGWAAQGDD